MVSQGFFHTVNALIGTTTPRFANGAWGAHAGHDPLKPDLANVPVARGLCRRALEEVCPRFA
jgi:hypothetical protein